MATHMLSEPDTNFTDPRKGSTDSDTKLVGKIIFTANATGSTTTIIGATENNGTNAVRVGDKGVIFKTDGTVRDGYKVVTVSGVGTSTSDTVTFAPALATSTVSGDTLRTVNPAAYVDNNSLDARLLALGFSQRYIDSLTQNDKVFQIRVSDDPTSLR